jgi:hypothetical protein
VNERQGEGRSISTELAEAAGPSISAMPLTAIKLARHNKLSRCANCVLTRRSKKAPLFDHLAAQHARLLSYAVDSHDVEFRVFLTNLERSLKFGRIKPTL